LLLIPCAKKVIKGWYLHANASATIAAEVPETLQHCFPLFGWEQAKVVPVADCYLFSSCNVSDSKDSGVLWCAIPF
jgi:hypothetical protein